jgi:predicted glycogen debranching enzyme
MKIIFRHTAGTELTPEELTTLTKTEWLVTNGLGGYASGTIGGTLTRVFHGYLIAALPAPLGRTMMLNDILEHVVLSDNSKIRLNGERTANGEYSGGSKYLAAFGLDGGLPVWVYEINGLTLERRIVVPHRQNTTYINYRLTSGTGSVKLELRPAVNMRAHEAPVSTPIVPYTLTVRENQYELRKSTDDLPQLRMELMGKAAAFNIDSNTIHDVIYSIEQSRGYIYQGDLWTPGRFSIEIDASHDASLVVSTENWNVMAALTPQQAFDAEQDRRRRLLREAHPDACDESCRELVWGADQFIFTPVGRQADAARARAAGDEICSIIAGYHWFTDWGRDTMISLEGLTLTTGRHVEANYILRTFAHYVHDGLIPNMFPEGKTSGLYHTADATLWFFHAFNRYLHYTHDHHLLNQLLPKMVDIVGHHLRGTDFNIHVDSADGLLSQGQDGYQLTWMDAKVAGWVVTPRRGKAVEINALWYNALRILENWLRSTGKGEEADGVAGHAARCRESFNRRFWYEKGGYLYDVVDDEDGKDDASCRPNQLFAISLEHPVLDESRWESVLHVTKERLLTPVGLRSLAPWEKDYKPKYDGDLRSRDAAYHQGTVWAWLLGPFVDAWLKVHPDDVASAKSFLSGFKGHLDMDCVGSISEIFDAEPPFAPRGCCAQAWSVAEVLRVMTKVAGRSRKTRPKKEKAVAVEVR